MKTLTKILSVTALIVLCVCLFTLTAFAVDVVSEVPATADLSTLSCKTNSRVHGYQGDDGNYYSCNVMGLVYGDQMPADAVLRGKAITDLDIGPKGTQHNWGSLVTGRAPNCTVPGELDHYRCSDCNAYSLDKTNAVDYYTVVYLPCNEDHDWVLDPSRSKANTDVSPGWEFYYCTRNPNHTKQDIIDARGITEKDGGLDIYYVVPVNNTWQPGQEGLTFSSPLVKLLNDESGPNANYVGVRLGQSSLYENSWDTFDFWSWDQYVQLGDKQMASLRPGEYKLWIYDRRHPDVFTQSCTFWVLDVPTLEPYSTDKHVVNSSKSLRFITDGEIVPGTIKVGARTLYDANDYFLSNDRKSVTLSPDFLNARQTGTYTISAVTKDGYTIKTNFYILSTAQASSSPRTGDESQIGLWAAFLLLSGAAIIVMVPKLRKSGVK